MRGACLLAPLVTTTLEISVAAERQRRIPTFPSPRYDIRFERVREPQGASAMSNELTPEALYMRLGQLVATMPDFLDRTNKTYQWLGRAIALVERGYKQGCQYLVCAARRGL
jgi:hypothetical protein